MQDYLEKLSILSQYSDPANALMLPDNGASSGENGTATPKTGNFEMEREDILSEVTPGECHINPAYLGNPSEDR